MSTRRNTESCEQSNCDLIFGRNAAISTIYLTSEREVNLVFWEERYYNPVGSDVRLLCRSVVEK